MFVLDRLKSSIVTAAADIQDAYRSINKSRVAPEGFHAQHGEAYLFTILRDDRHRVFAALHLFETGKVLVYAPEGQPLDLLSYGKAFEEGIDFLESIGFMMDAVELGDDAGKRARILGKFPVLTLVDYDGPPAEEMPYPVSDDVSAPGASTAPLLTSSPEPAEGRAPSSPARDFRPSVAESYVEQIGRLLVSL